MSPNKDVRKRNTSCTKMSTSLEDFFKQLNRKYIKIKKRDRKCNNAILCSVLNDFLKIMKEKNQLFNRMKPRLEYLGSYYDGLRVGEPTEYDINVVLKLPINYKKIILDATAVHSHDSTHIYMSSEFRRLAKTPKTADEGFNETLLWCDKDHRLSVKKFHSWMQKVVDSTLRCLSPDSNRGIICVNDKFYQIDSKTSGPACTITITARTGSRPNKPIDVDLVPTFEFQHPKTKIGSNVLLNRVSLARSRLGNKNNGVINNNVTYYAVPKPSDDNFSWRLAFPDLERKLIKNKNYLKSSAKIIKLLRDTQNFRLLASYYIKTIFLWEVCYQDDSFWSRNSLSYITLYMLKKLRDCLSKAEIKNFWCPEVNLLTGRVKPETCENWSNRLKLIINHIEETKNLDQFFKQ